MVGVGGRSKGCRTCRRRKIKCDEGKPGCERCRKSGFDCEGYVKYHEFVDLTARLIRNDPPKKEPVTETALLANADGDSHGELGREVQASFMINPSLDEDSIFTSHLIHRLFSWHEDDLSPYSASWISVLFRHPEDPGGLPMRSVRALATSYFGKVHGHQDLMRKGANSYSQALRILRGQLQHYDQVLESEVVVAIVCLGIYELVTFTQPWAWLQHYKGLARLSIGHIVDRKRCFLEDPAWKTIPWAKKGQDAKTPTDRVLDILCDIPGILEDYDRALDPMTPNQAQFTAELCTKILSTMDALYNWRWAWQEEFPNATYLTVPNNASSPGSMQLPPSPFQTVIWFQDPLRATELSFYDSLLLILQGMCERFGIGMEPSFVPLMSDPLLPMQGTRMDTTREICRMADYQLHDLRRSSGAFMLLFPLNVAYRNLIPNSVEALWLEKIMALIADTHGFEMSRRENMPRP
ncbi:hypothetical protein N7510_007567 [Penicillium lagena]|uniref:uncharacterized protein n=1 Tax=Penicillium lagena TaxID=94218 RepID=UPI00253F930E|nr:uncharacterized protein N7510_007567 [Penicillium lagena]KAJ5610848.1 hypothetical protein N7510_007567 [Penicillium lagena]